MILRAVRFTTVLLLLVSSSSSNAAAVLDLTAVFAAAENSLRESEALQGSVENTLREAHATMVNEVPPMESMLVDLADQMNLADERIQQLNVRQVQELSDKLRQVQEKEMQRRSRESMLNGDGVPEEAIKQAFEPLEILASSEENLQEWVLGIVQEEMEELQQRALAASEPEQCVSPETAVNMVQEALSNLSRDEIGLQDHARTGTILHEFTSPTYVPPTPPKQQLGNVWWRNYIPQDWELLLPANWQSWNVGVPSSLWHTVRLNGGATTAPETVLHPNTMPGSCWPMQGTSGKIMIDLPYPVKVTAVSVDHTSPQLLVDEERQLQSAPKRVRMIGYAPCNGNCGGLSFDPTRKVVIANAEYDIKGGSIQTWPVKIGSAEAAAALDEGSCSSSSCSAPPENDPSSGIYAAIEVDVLDNWGNEAYTCLYRIRVHGEAEV